MTTLYKNIELIVMSTAEIVLLVLARDDYIALRKSLDGASPEHADTILGVPFKVGLGRRSYAIEDTFEGPLFHMV